MKIAIDVRNIGRKRTGSEVVVRELVRHVLARDTQNTYYLLTDTTDASVHEAIRTGCDLNGRANAKIVALPVTSRGLWVLWAVPRFVRQTGIDVFHTEYIVPFFLPSCVRVVTHIHDVSFAAVPHYIGKKDLFFLQHLIPRSLRRADVIVAVSAFTKKEIVRHYGVSPEKVAVVPNGLAPQFTHVATEEMVTTVRERYHLPQQYILSLGTMQPRKNIPFLVAAFARIADKIPEVDLVLTGRRAHNFDHAISATIAQYPHVMHRIHFTGFVDDALLPPLYAGARAFAFPSVYEGFGLPLIEAMSQGAPIIAHDAAVFREVAGDVAYYADARDLAAFSEALYTVVMLTPQERAAIRRDGVERARTFTWSDAAQRFHNLLTDTHNETL